MCQLNKEDRIIIITSLGDFNGPTKSITIVMQIMAKESSPTNDHDNNNNGGAAVAIDYCWNSSETGCQGGKTPLQNYLALRFNSRYDDGPFPTRK